jgi:hypothetical protein
MFNATSEPSTNIVGGDIVTAFDHSLLHATDCFANIGNPNEMQFDRIAALLRLFEMFTYACPLSVDS